MTPRTNGKRHGGSRPLTRPDDGRRTGNRRPHLHHPTTSAPGSWMPTLTRPHLSRLPTLAEQEGDLS
jgi:hypothetical protein